MIRGWVPAWLLAVPLAASAAGSGTVEFEFTSFSGPMAMAQQSKSSDPTQWASRGVVNGVVPTANGWADSGYRFSDPSDPDGYVTGSLAQVPGGGNSVTLKYEWDLAGDYENVISFAPRDFVDVAAGQDFVLGTLSFKNGGWYGGGATAAFNTPTQLGFTITTSSSSGQAFNQTLSGFITMVVNSPYPNDTTTLAGQQAEADWVYFVGAGGGSVAADMGSFRVYDDCCKPEGFTATGSVDVVARFGSLDLVSFANPQGGFVNGSLGALPPSLLVPEPGTWATLLAGLGLTAAVVRARRQSSAGG
jgi:hypothetical protein